MAPQSTRDLRIIQFGDLPLLTGPASAIARWMLDCALLPSQQTLVAHVNANNYYCMSRRPAFRERLQRKGVLLADGVGLQIAMGMCGQRQVADLNGTDLFPLVMTNGQQRGLRVYLLGGTSSVIEAAARAIPSRFPGIEVVGSHHGYFHPSQESQIAHAIRQAAPHMLLVGLGFHKQEEFSLRHRETIATPLIWNVGGLFDFVSGSKPRAPRALLKLRLEWLFRFLRDPHAMWHRNLVAAPWFVCRAFAIAVTFRKSEAHPNREGHETWG